MTSLPWSLLDPWFGSPLLLQRKKAGMKFKWSQAWQTLPLASAKGHCWGKGSWHFLAAHRARSPTMLIHVIHCFAYNPTMLLCFSGARQKLSIWLLSALLARPFVNITGRYGIRSPLSMYHQLWSRRRRIIVQWLFRGAGVWLSIRYTRERDKRVYHTTDYFVYFFGITFCSSYSVTKIGSATYASSCTKALLMAKALTWSTHGCFPWNS